MSENNKENDRQISKDLQELAHLGVCIKSLANIVGIRIDDIILREANRKRNGDESKK